MEDDDGRSKKKSSKDVRTEEQRECNRIVHLKQLRADLLASLSEEKRIKRNANSRKIRIRNIERRRVQRNVPSCTASIDLDVTGGANQTIVNNEQKHTLDRSYEFGERTDWKYHLKNDYYVKNDDEDAETNCGNVHAQNVTFVEPRPLTKCRIKAEIEDPVSDRSDYDDRFEDRNVSIKQEHWNVSVKQEDCTHLIKQENF